MWNIIKKYYLLTFIGFFVATGIKTFTTESTHSFIKNALITVVTAFVVSLIAGTLYYFLDTKWGPNKRIKMFSKKPFTELFMNGFVQKDDVAAGIVDRYMVIVNYSWPNGVSAIGINVLFDKDFAARYNGDIADVKSRNKPYLWNEGAVGRLLTYNFSPPSYNKILETAEKMISVLKTEGLPPTNSKDKDKQQPKLATGNTTSFHAMG
jgi:hypothetical protein